MKKRFTLVEVLAVVFLIGILTAIGFGMYSYAMNAAKDKATRSLFARLGAAIESCNTKFGLIPTSTTGTTPTFDVITVKVNAGEITELTFGGRTFKNSVTNDKDFLKEFQRVVDLETLKKNIKSDELEDSWGGKIYYAYPGKFNKTGYDLYSAGPDGRIGKDNDDLTQSNLNSSAIGDYKDSSDNSMVCDDIVNF